MDLTDVLQMLGRAGRPQFDSSGVARIFTQESKKGFYKHFLHTGFPVESSLHRVLDNHLGAEISAGTIPTKQDALDYLTWTFFFRRLHKNPSFYGLEISAEEHNTALAQTMANEYMVKLVDDSLDQLAESRCATVEATGDIGPTPLGKTMSYYYLSHKTIRYLVEQARRDASFQDVLCWVSHASEYDELPVRHNEDLINAELSRTLPFKAEVMQLPFGNAHVKAFLLFQAHFSRIDLPISDYVGDANSVLDQSIRIVQASIDVVTELGYLSSFRMLVMLLQCIKCARWPTDGPLSPFPGVDVAKEKQREDGANAAPKSLVEAAGAPAKELEQAATAAGVARSAMGPFLGSISRLPNIALSASGVCGAKVTVRFTRLNAARGDTQQGVRAYTPRFPKPQTEGFFVALSHHDRDEILALKRIGWQKRSVGGASRPERGSGSTPKLQANAWLAIPDPLSQRKMDVTVLSDAYINMQWSTDSIEVPEAH